MFRKRFFYSQHDLADCGPTCLKMICRYYGKDVQLEYLREKCYINKDGVSLLNISKAAEDLGFRTFMAYLDVERLVNDCPLPAILHWNQEHFVLLLEIKGKKYFKIADPAHGIVKIDLGTFKKSWISTADQKGAALLLEPTPAFSNLNEKGDEFSGYKFLLKYIKPYKRNFFQLIFGMMIGSLISLILPFATKILIDEGINKGSASIIYLVLLSQFALFVGSTLIELIRGWLLLHVNTRISLNIISDFLIQLLKLPIRFFDTKSVGDLSQRIGDHHRIDTFLTGTAISTIFSIVNIIVFSIILLFFDKAIFLSFFVLSVLGVLWVFLFQKKRKQLDYKRFARNRENQDKLYEMIVGMQEVKLYGSEISKRWEWERLQIKFFKLNISTLALEQWQSTGFNFLTSLKNIIISFLAATQVLNGNLTLGTLLSISYIIGQTNGPISQLMAFIQGFQDAKLSMDRLLEIHKKRGEEQDEEIDHSFERVENQDLNLENVSFQYSGPDSPLVLNNITLCIPKGKVTAIVGTSGSGKSTLLKLMLGFYKPVKGIVKIGESDLKRISPKLWREACGTVMQDGFIFFDTISRNIAVDGMAIDDKRMENAVKIANLSEFIDRLPLGYTTKIGSSGVGLSGGQKQRILIARSVYKDPEYLFFDEATSSLDANNERQIIDNLDDFFKGKTVVIIAHRLSTVKNADQIVVLKDGEIVEIGNHTTLSKAKGNYYELVKNQLELGD
ncbi:RTX-I toxin determinant B [Sphingobacterium mizutaii]|uniref:RTX-I toxin determinant B n=2 Tax=Sphingobacterium mizutaii TaxID=1010 RepID=A0AAJ4X891_9SPHI|nr:peptidase domain-containing ABC transporter [Sphingobacterium mizutaii]SDL77629.1 ATP-binding cassette, subfamily B [Sphingobacterium mizutaii]SNV38122.1 RTX-I toxin determinant B [Sphingobacterium mizutaii]